MNKAGAEHIPGQTVGIIRLIFSQAKPIGPRPKPISVEKLRFKLDGMFVADLISPVSIKNKR